MSVTATISKKSVSFMKVSYPQGADMKFLTVLEAITKGMKVDVKHSKLAMKDNQIVHVGYKSSKTKPIPVEVMLHIPMDLNKFIKDCERLSDEYVEELKLQIKSNVMNDTP